MSFIAIKSIVSEGTKIGPSVLKDNIIDDKADLLFISDENDRKTDTRLRTSLLDKLGKPAPERLNLSGF